MPHVVIANRLSDGIVVFLGPEGSWVENIDHSEIAEDDEASKRLEAGAAEAVAKQLVVGPELIPVKQVNGECIPTQRREFIRARGPSVRKDLGKQAGN